MNKPLDKATRLLQDTRQELEGVLTQELIESDPVPRGDSSQRQADRLLAGLAVVAFLIPILPNLLLGGYGYFIDELYYIACSERLAAGYVDHPPLAPWLLALSRTFLGDSVLAIRVLPALAFAASVFLTGLMARRLGAGLFGQGLAALAVMLAPVPLIFAGFFSMNPFEILLWVGACYVLIEILRTGNERLWLVFGLVAGLGLLNKHTFVLLAAGLAVGVVLTPARRHLMSRWLWLGAGLAFVLLLPNLLWQVQHGWPSLEFYRNADLNKNVDTPPLKVLIDQILFMNPVSALIWGAGLVFCFASSRGRPYRALGWIFLTLMAMTLIAQKSRPDRIAGIYPVMLAAGAAWWDLGGASSARRWARGALPVLLIVVAVLMAPLCLPILPPDQLARYSAAAGIVPQLERGAGKVTAMPQWFADRFGWPELVEEVVGVVERELTPDERRRALILTPSYGHAGAIERLGERYDLPPVASPQNTYHLWGLGEGPLDVLVSVDIGPEPLLQFYEEVREVGRYRCEYCMPWRDDAPIYVARRPKLALRDYWDRFRHFE
ncbi:MAG: glycosyltransferase family 39 protein [Acidobacteriota bacterium]